MSEAGIEAVFKSCPLLRSLKTEVGVHSSDLFAVVQHLPFLIAALARVPRAVKPSVRPSWMCLWRTRGGYDCGTWTLAG